MLRNTSYQTKKSPNNETTSNKENKEVVNYNNTIINCEEPYTAIFDLTELKTTLENCIEPYLTINFGDHTSIVISRGHISNLIPECDSD